ncbi:MAG: ABC transporter permease [Deltaproteobacteria bacterium]|nr:ABC transporter permease [Deltaproteobacteria bacterium]
MDFLFDSLKSAVLLLWSLDRDLLIIVSLSLKVSFFSTLIAGIAGIPLGLAIELNDFRGKRLVITVLNTLLSLPTVVIGLFVYSFISRRGLLGAMGLLYTPKAIIIGQIILILPIITTLTITALSRLDSRYRKTAMTLGANSLQTALVIVREARFGIVAAIIMAFGRVIAEVGISMMLGGNAKGFTRTMTTAMALEFDKGEFTMSVALGILLLLISFSLNIVFNYFQGKTGD